MRAQRRGHSSPDEEACPAQADYSPDGAKSKHCTWTAVTVAPEPGNVTRSSFAATRLSEQRDARSLASRSRAGAHALALLGCYRWCGRIIQGVEPLCVSKPPNGSP
eukprot:6213752-Pleurochrysis_carterae.AAC.4